MAEGILSHTWTPEEVTARDEYDGGDTWGSLGNKMFKNIPQPYKDFTLTSHDRDYDEIIHGRPNETLMH